MGLRRPKTTGALKVTAPPTLVEQVRSLHQRGAAEGEHLAVQVDNLTTRLERTKQDHMETGRITAGLASLLGAE